MLYSDAFKTATRALTHGKMRSVLTMLGIVIGIASVIILMSIGRSAQNLILGQVQDFGSDLIVVIPGAPAKDAFSAPAASQGIVITSLRARDVAALKREPSVSAVSPQVTGQASVVRGNTNETVTYQGVDEGFFEVRTIDLKAGQHFTKADVDSSNRVAIIGPDLAEKLFGTYSDPIGQTIRLKNVSFRVVGVLKAGGTGPFGVDQGNMVLIPLTIAQRQLLGISYYNTIMVQADSLYEPEFVKSRIISVLRQEHSIAGDAEDDFDVRTLEEALEIVGTITSVLTYFLAAIASISLLVGGIGIMNIMLVSVTERTREIGLRKSVGATDRDILQQFLIESVFLTVLGGAIGIALGAGVVGLVSLALAFGAPDLGWGFALPLSAVLLALGVSSASGLAFGIYPARQAGRKNPIDALRYE